MVGAYPSILYTLDVYGILAQTEIGVCGTKLLRVQLIISNISSTSESEVYMIKIMSELRLKNRSERDLRIIAQSVEHRTGIAEVVGSHPVEASEFYGASISYDLVIWTTEKKTFCMFSLLDLRCVLCSRRSNRRFPSYLSLCFKANPSAKPFICKFVLFTCE